MPLAIDLFCGLGGWTEGLLAEGYRVVGFDVERHVYGDAKYPAQLVLQDVLTIHGAQFKGAALIVASPPCQEFSYMAMPWSRAKEKARKLREGEDDPKRLTALFDACFRIQREACEAAGRHIPMVVENVRGAQPWVGKSKWNYGSFHLWGDIPLLMPMTKPRAKVGGLSWSDHSKPGYKPMAFNGEADKRLRDDAKNNGGSWFNVAHNTTSGKGQNPDGRKGSGGTWFTHHGTGQHWKDGGCVTRRYSSKSTARKAASAHIAKIPFALSSHIARAWYPE